MELMAVPCLAAPMAAGGLGAIVLAYADGGTDLKRWERLSAWIAGGLTLLVFGALTVLG